MKSRFPKCQVCGRPLKNPESVILGVGPECRDRQQHFMSACDTSLEEIGQLVLLADDTVAKWTRAFAGACRDHRKDLGLAFIDAARRAAAALAEERGESFESLYLKIAGVPAGNEVSAEHRRGNGESADVSARDSGALGINL